MKISRNSGLILALAFAFSLPINASAEEAAAPVAAAEPAALQPMQDMMREMRRDPSKCKTMQNAASNPDAPAPMPGMGLGRGGMSGDNCKPGGGMQGQNKPCMQDRHMNCHLRGGVDDQRLDALEKRMDMMQMMLEMMLRAGGKN